MGPPPTAPPGALEPRFQAPAEWRWHSFNNGQGRTLRFGSAFPPSKPRWMVVILPGLSEFCEKYFETARDLLALGCAVWVLDWPGQGRSDRFFAADPERRHTAGFDADIQSFDIWLRNYVRPAGGGVPLALLAHSMGGHIALRWLADQPGLVQAAGFTAPMIGIRALSRLPRFAAPLLMQCVSRPLGTRYVPGGGPWKVGAATLKAPVLLTSDPARGAVPDAWYAQDPALRVGGVTFGWIDAAYRSCLALQAPGLAERISIPCLVALAGRESLVDNHAARRFAARMPHARVLDLPQSLHEILMERDDHRNLFLNAFRELLDLRR